MGTGCRTESYCQRNKSILFASVSNSDIIFVVVADTERSLYLSEALLKKFCFVAFGSDLFGSARVLQYFTGHETAP